MENAHGPLLRLLGTPCLQGDGHSGTWSAERRCQLLAVLALRTGQWVPRDELASLLWPQHAHGEARRNLRKVIFRAAALPGVQQLQTTAHALRWDIHTDLQALRARLADGTLQDVLACGQHRLMHGLDDDDNPALRDWLAAERERWHAAWHRAALAALARCDDAAQRAEGAEQLLAIDPLDEAALQHLLGARQSLGQPASAHAAYRRYAEQLAEQLGVEPSRVLRQLALGAQAEVGVPEVARAAATQAVAQAAAPVNAPGASTQTFVGRKAELADLAARLRSPDVRWINLLGPGGIGKSRLAHQVLQTMEPLWPGRCLWVDLQDLDALTALFERLAHHFGIPGGAADPLEPLLARLGDQPALWVLDNAEHQVPPPVNLGLWLQTLLERAPALRVLSTSRVRFHAALEQAQFLEGLPVPDADSRDLEAAQAYDAVHLFELRARAAQRDFKLAQHLPHVIDIVEQVDGLPLAIELAAAWVRVLPPAEIAGDLRQSLDVLERDDNLPGAPARPQHDSLSKVVSGSWELLAPSERELLEALSVSRSGATLALARAVARASLPLLSSLVDRSMLAVNAQGRFSLHPIVHSHAAQRLALRGPAADDVRRRHAAHMAAFVRDLEPHARGDTRVLIDAISAERANIDAAWALALREQRFELLHAMARSLWSYFEHRSLVVEGIALLEPALLLPADTALAQRCRQRLLHGLSMLHHRRGRHAQGLALAEAGLALGDLGDLESWLGCLLNAGSCEWESGRVDLARDRFAQAVALARERQDRACEAWALGNLGVADVEMGRLEDATRAFRQALQMDRDIGNHYQVAVHLNNLVSALRTLRDWPQALALCDEGLQVAQAHRLETLGTLLRLKMAAIHEALGDAEQARSWCARSIHHAELHGLGPALRTGELTMVRLDLMQDRPAEALRRLQGLAVLSRAQDATLDLVRAVATYALWLSRCGRTADAARAWRVAAASRDSQPRERADWLQRLADLPTGHAEPDTHDTVDALLAALAADAAALDAPRPARSR